MCVTQNFKRHSEWQRFIYKQTGQLSLSNCFFRRKASDLSCHTEFFIFSPSDLSNPEVIRHFPKMEKRRFKVLSCLNRFRKTDWGCLLGKAEYWPKGRRQKESPWIKFAVLKRDSVNKYWISLKTLHLVWALPWNLTMNYKEFPRKREGDGEIQ